jgi:hypothetical protein
MMAQPHHPHDSVADAEARQLMVPFCQQRICKACLLSGCGQAEKDADLEEGVTP